MKRTLLSLIPRRFQRYLYWRGKRKVRTWARTLSYLLHSSAQRQFDRALAMLHNFWYPRI